MSDNTIYDNKLREAVAAAFERHQNRLNESGGSENTQLLFEGFASIAQFEHELSRSRARSGIARLRVRDRRIGRDRLKTVGQTRTRVTREELQNGARTITMRCIPSRQETPTSTLMDEGQEWVQPSFHNYYRGLAEKKHDPTNFFCVNQNIKHSGIGPNGEICCCL